MAVETLKINQPFPLSAPARNLQRLCGVRLIVWMLEAGATLYAFLGPQLPLPYGWLFALLMLHLLLIIVTLLRLRHPWPVTDVEFFTQLLADILLLCILLYLTGGANNPFVSYFLVPLTISAATLPWLYTCGIMLCSLLAYSLLLFYYIPFELLTPAHAHAGLNWHILGMWINFIVSAGLITFFVVRMAHSLRQQDRLLQLSREKHLRNEHVIGIATIAANTTHTLGTPLSTMAVVLNELTFAHDDDPALKQDLELLRQQVQTCKNTLQQLTKTAERLQQSHYETVPADRFIRHLLDEWHDMRPAVQCDISFSSETPAPGLSNAPTLAQAIQNLLDNAADASPERLEIGIDWDDKAVRIHIRDFGSGIPMELAEQLGKPFFSTKATGLGIGLFLSHATLDRFGGHVRLFNHHDGGTLTRITIPVTRNDG